MACRAPCGCCEQLAVPGFFIRQPDVQPLRRDENALHLGNSGGAGTTLAALLDDLTADVYAAPSGEACRILRTQSIPQVNLPEG